MKQKILTVTIILLSLLLLSFVVSGSRKNTGKTEETKETEGQVLGEDLIDILYWGATCPHCHDTIEWIEENKIEEKIKIIKKEVYNNQNNTADLSKKAQICGLDENNIGVPLMFTKDQKCLIGTPDITSYLQDEIKKQ